MMPPVETILAQGRYFDGASARPHPVTIRLGDRLQVTGEGIHEDWSLLDLRASETQAPTLRLFRAGSPARVEFTHEALSAALAARCPDLHKGEAEGGGTLRLVLWSIAAGVSVLLVAIFGVPALAALLAPFLPVPVEARLGTEVDRQVVAMLGDPQLCTDPAGQAALDRLVARMTEGVEFPITPVVSVRRHRVANALTLPGGRVIVLSDVIAKARTPDEFAAILAHEFGHVAARDPTRSVITAGGISFLLSLILGDVTGSTVIVAIGQAAISAGYSRDAERAADAYGVAMLRRAGGDPTALATILERIDSEADKEPGFAAFLRSHPFTRDRAAAIRGLAGEGTAGNRILSEADWQALRRICGRDPGKQGGGEGAAPQPTSRGADNPSEHGRNH